jgi:hypothetical protein
LSEYGRCSELSRALAPAGAALITVAISVRAVFECRIGDSLSNRENLLTVLRGLLLVLGL